MAIPRPCFLWPFAICVSLCMTLSRSLYAYHSSSLSLPPLLLPLLLSLFVTVNASHSYVSLYFPIRYNDTSAGLLCVPPLLAEPVWGAVAFRRPDVL